MLASAILLNDPELATYYAAQRAKSSVMQGHDVLADLCVIHIREVGPAYPSQLAQLVVTWKNAPKAKSKKDVRHAMWSAVAQLCAAPKCPVVPQVMDLAQVGMVHAPFRSLVPQDPGRACALWKDLVVAVKRKNASHAVIKQLGGGVEGPEVMWFLVTLTAWIRVWEWMQYTRNRAWEGQCIWPTLQNHYTTGSEKAAFVATQLKSEEAVRYLLDDPAVQGAPESVIADLSCVYYALLSVCYPLRDLPDPLSQAPLQCDECLGEKLLQNQTCPYPYAVESDHPLIPFGFMTGEDPPQSFALDVAECREFTGMFRHRWPMIDNKWAKEVKSILPPLHTTLLETKDSLTYTLVHAAVTKEEKEEEEEQKTGPPHPHRGEPDADIDVALFMRVENLSDTALAELDLPASERKDRSYHYAGPYDWDPSILSKPPSDWPRNSPVVGFIIRCILFHRCGINVPLWKLCVHESSATAYCALQTVKVDRSDAFLAYVVSQAPQKGEYPYKQQLEQTGAVPLVPGMIVSRGTDTKVRPGHTVRAMHYLVSVTFASDPSLLGRFFADLFYYLGMRRVALCADTHPDHPITNVLYGGAQSLQMIDLKDLYVPRHWTASRCETIKEFIKKYMSPQSFENVGIWIINLFAQSAQSESESKLWAEWTEAPKKLKMYPKEKEKWDQVPWRTIKEVFASTLRSNLDRSRSEFERLPNSLRPLVDLDGLRSRLDGLEADLRSVQLISVDMPGSPQGQASSSAAPTFSSSFVSVVPADAPMLPVVSSSSVMDSSAVLPPSPSSRKRPMVGSSPQRPIIVVEDEEDKDNNRMIEDRHGPEDIVDAEPLPSYMPLPLQPKDVAPPSVFPHLVSRSFTVMLAGILRLCDLDAQTEFDTQMVRSYVGADLVDLPAGDAPFEFQSPTRLVNRLTQEVTEHPVPVYHTFAGLSVVPNIKAFPPALVPPTETSIHPPTLVGVQQRVLQVRRPWLRFVLNYLLTREPVKSHGDVVPYAGFIAVAVALAQPFPVSVQHFDMLLIDNAKSNYEFRKYLDGMRVPVMDSYANYETLRHLNIRPLDLVWYWSFLIWGVHLLSVTAKYAISFRVREVLDGKYDIGEYRSRDLATWHRTPVEYTLDRLRLNPKLRFYQHKDGSTNADPTRVVHLAYFRNPKDGCVGLLRKSSGELYGSAKNVANIIKFLLRPPGKDLEGGALYQLYLNLHEPKTNAPRVSALTKRLRASDDLGTKTGLMPFPVLVRSIVEVGGELDMVSTPERRNISAHLRVYFGTRLYSGIADDNAVRKAVFPASMTSVDEFRPMYKYIKAKFDDDGTKTVHATALAHMLKVLEVQFEEFLLTGKPRVHLMSSPAPRSRDSSPFANHLLWIDFQRFMADTAMVKHCLRAFLEVLYWPSSPLMARKGVWMMQRAIEVYEQKQLHDDEDADEMKERGSTSRPFMHWTGEWKKRMTDTRMQLDRMDPNDPMIMEDALYQGAWLLVLLTPAELRAFGSFMRYTYYKLECILGRHRLASHLAASLSSIEENMAIPKAYDTVLHLRLQWYCQRKGWTTEQLWDKIYDTPTRFDDDAKAVWTFLCLSKSVDYHGDEFVWRTPRQRVGPSFVPFHATLADEFKFYGWESATLLVPRLIASSQSVPVSTDLLQVVIPSLPSDNPLNALSMHWPYHPVADMSRVKDAEMHAITRVCIGQGTFYTPFHAIIYGLVCIYIEETQFERDGRNDFDDEDVQPNVVVGPTKILTTGMLPGDSDRYSHPSYDECKMRYTAVLEDWSKVYGTVMSHPVVRSCVELVTETVVREYLCQKPDLYKLLSDLVTQQRRLEEAYWGPDTAQFEPWVTNQYTPVASFKDSQGLWPRLLVQCVLHTPHIWFNGEENVDHRFPHYSNLAKRYAEMAPATWQLDHQDVPLTFVEFAFQQYETFIMDQIKHDQTDELEFKTPDWKIGLNLLLRRDDKNKRIVPLLQDMNVWLHDIHTGPLKLRRLQTPLSQSPLGMDWKDVLGAVEIQGMRGLHVKWDRSPDLDMVLGTVFLQPRDRDPVMLMSVLETTSTLLHNPDFDRYVREFLHTTATFIFGETDPREDQKLYDEKVAMVCDKYLRDVKEVLQKQLMDTPAHSVFTAYRDLMQEDAVGLLKGKAEMVHELVEHYLSQRVHDVFGTVQMDETKSRKFVGAVDMRVRDNEFVTFLRRTYPLRQWHFKINPVPTSSSSSIPPSMEWAQDVFPKFSTGPKRGAPTVGKMEDESLAPSPPSSEASSGVMV